MSTNFLFQRDVQGYNSFGLPISKDKYSATIAATTDTTLTVPSNNKNWIAYFSVEVSKLVWFALNGIAAAPAGDSFAATTSELLPSNRNVGRSVKAGDVLHFFSQSGTANVSVIFYAVP